MDDASLASRIYAKTNEYLDFPSVVGHEAPFLDHLARDFRAAGYASERRRNMVIVDAGAPEPLFLAHVDRHGLILTGRDQARYAALEARDVYNEDAAAKGALQDKLRERFVGEEVFVYDRTTGGRLAYGEVGAFSPGDGGDDALFHLEGLPPLPLGAPVSFARPLSERDGYVTGQLDNPVSVAVLRLAAEIGLIGRFVFTAEEEIGRSAGHVAAWATSNDLETRRIVVVDTSPLDDMDAIDRGLVILRRKDATAPFDPRMTDALARAAFSAELETAFKDDIVDRTNQDRPEGERIGYGRTELGRLIDLTGGRLTGSTLQIPTFGYHTNAETTSRLALLAAARTLLALQA